MKRLNDGTIPAPLTTWVEQQLCDLLRVMRSNFNLWVSLSDQTIRCCNHARVIIQRQKKRDKSHDYSTLRCSWPFACLLVPHFAQHAPDLARTPAKPVDVYFPSFPFDLIHYVHELVTTTSTCKLYVYSSCTTRIHVPKVRANQLSKCGEQGCARDEHNAAGGEGDPSAVLRQLALCCE